MKKIGIYVNIYKMSITNVSKKLIKDLGRLLPNTACLAKVTNNGKRKFFLKRTAVNVLNLYRTYYRLLSDVICRYIS